MSHLGRHLGGTRLSEAHRGAMGPRMAARMAVRTAARAGTRSVCLSWVFPHEGAAGGVGNQALRPAGQGDRCQWPELIWGFGPGEGT